MGIHPATIGAPPQRLSHGLIKLTKNPKWKDSGRRKRTLNMKTVIGCLTLQKLELNMSTTSTRLMFTRKPNFSWGLLCKRIQS